MVGDNTAAMAVGTLVLRHTGSVTRERSQTAYRRARSSVVDGHRKADGGVEED